MQTDLSAIPTRSKVIQVLTFWISLDRRVWIYVLFRLNEQHSCAIELHLYDADGEVQAPVVRQHAFSGFELDVVFRGYLKLILRKHFLGCGSFFPVLPQARTNFGTYIIYVLNIINKSMGKKNKLWNSCTWINTNIEKFVNFGNRNI